MPSPAPDKIKQTKKIDVTGDLLSVARVPGTEQLWIGSSDFKLYFIDLAVDNPKPAPLGGHDSYVSGVVLAESAIVSAGWDRKLIWWDRETRKPTRTVEAHQRWIRQLAVSDDGKQLATISDDMSCKLWDAKSGQLIRELNGHAKVVPRYDYRNKLFACTFSPDGKYVAAADELCEVIIWETKTGKEQARIEASSFFTHDWERNNHPWGGLRTMAFSPNGNQLALGGMKNKDVAIISGNGLVQIFDWQAGKQLNELKAGENLQFESLCFERNSQWLLAASGGGSKSRLILMNPDDGTLIKEVDSQMPIFGVAINETAEKVYAVGRQQITVWEIA
ncbi:MAG: WD40 repeat protein [Pirellulaceae bacterium]|jgi:WD40 repeat protein